MLWLPIETVQTCLPNTIQCFVFCHCVMHLQSEWTYSITVRTCSLNGHIALLYTISFFHSHGLLHHVWMHFQINIDILLDMSSMLADFSLCHTQMCADTHTHTHIHSLRVEHWRICWPITLPIVFYVCSMGLNKDRVGESRNMTVGYDGNC